MPNKLITTSFPGVAPDGINLNKKPMDIADTQAQYIFDGLLDFPDLLYRRGPLLDKSFTIGAVATGVVATTNPLGDFIIGVLNNSAGSSVLSTFNPAFSPAANIPFPATLTVTPPFYNYSFSPSIGGGCLISVSDRYAVGFNNPKQFLMFWYGGRSLNYSTGSLTVIRGSGTVTGSGTAWLANVSPGMYLFADTLGGTKRTYIGTIQSVDSDTSMQLEKASLYDAAVVNYNTQALRDFYGRAAKGRITCATSAATVSGSATKFSSQMANPILTSSSPWQLFRTRDQAFIGTLSTVTNETALTLTANAAVACTEERFFAVDPNYVNTIHTNVVQVGYLSASYANRQWYGNIGTRRDGQDSNKVWFSEVGDPESVDISGSDGDFIPVGSMTEQNPMIRALFPTQNALLVFKSSEVFGIFGNSPSTFNVRKIADEGCLFPMSIQPYKEGVVWAGPEGIYYYNGTTTQNIVEETLGNFYLILMRSLDETTYKTYSMYNNDYYFLFLENFSNTLTITKGASTVPMNRMTIGIHLPTGKVSFFTNLNIRGTIKFPVGSNFKTYYLVNTATNGKIADALDLFNGSGADNITCDGGTAGPKLFIETKKFNFGEPLQRKLIKQVALNYLADNAGISMDAIPGVSEPATAYTTSFPATPAAAANLKTARVKIYKRQQHISFRFYESGNSNVAIGSFELQMRPQRVSRY